MKKNRTKVQVMINLVMTVVAVITVFPFLLLIMASFTDNDAIIRNGYSLFPEQFSLEAYSYIWGERTQIFRAYFITIFVTAVGTAVSLLMTLMYAYALSKQAFPGKRFFTFFLLFTMLFNGGLVPTYTMYTRYFHMRNSIFALLIPGMLLGAMNVILIRSYMQNNLPASLTESAYIDGANEWQIFFKIAVPLSKPIVVTIGLFIGVGYWNNWTNGLYYITDEKLFSIQQVLTNMMRNIQYLSNNASSSASITSITIPQATVRMAIAVIGILPILIIYPYVQRYFVRGITLGAVKG